MSKETKERNNRREHPRVSADTEIKIASIVFKGEDHFQIGRTRNISCSGMYCNVNKFIIPLTKVQGIIKLPLDNKKDNNVSFKGVVVRTKPERDIDGWQDYNVAIFFNNNMLLEEKQKIKKYLDSKKYKFLK